MLALVREPRTPTAGSAATRLARFGAGALHDEELLAVILGSAAGGVPRTLLEPSGLAGLAAAGLSDLPIGTRRAAAIVAAVELGRRVASAWPATGWRIRAPADLAERLIPAMGHLEREELRSILLNTKNTVTGMVTVYAGNLAGSSVRVGEVFREAVRRQSAAIVVAHNHPSGDPAPSAEDLRITRELAEAGRLLDIELLDHLVIGHGRWVSLRSLGVI
ncbi:MAG TPA: DNA repair protein RadC [Candidatus Limnocylindria bacterium]|jgi:DNA repair protein RadC|nr:DNA repair protein RadC [Candidatus Limnocylindria bacterium]